MSILHAPPSSPSLSEPDWTPAPDLPHLPIDQLHIWRVRLESPRWQDSACPVDRFRADSLTPALFRNEIVSRYKTHPGITAGPISALNVAVAQCDHVALIAVSRAVRQIGLDLERVQQDIPFDEMAGGFLDARSQWDLRITWSRQEKAWKFFQFWTSNEACAKAQPFSRSPSHLNGFSPEPDFVAALAVQGGPQPEIRYWDWQC